MDARSHGLWFDTLPEEPAPRPPLPGDLDADVAVVGGGLTGLWTALELRRADPTLRVVVLEKAVCGFGASGRNGGWCSALFSAGLGGLVRRHGRDAAVAMQRALQHTVDEVGRAVAEEGIDCQWAKGGTITLARSPAQAERIRAEVAEAHELGLAEHDHRWLTAGEAEEHVRATRVVGAGYTPHCAAVHPARLVRGVAAAAERHGAVIHEGTPVLDLTGRSARTPAGSVRADVVVRALEGYTAALPGARRLLAPVYSLMIATEPLPDEAWERIGLAARPTFTDGRRLIVYGQRTAEGRFAFGGRGAPYHYGSRVQPAFDRDPAVFADLHRSLLDLFPDLDGVRITHEWGGPLGVPRDWHSAVGYDRGTGLAWAGGYVGDGVSTTNLAGRTLADLILGRDTDLVHLPWVGHRWPRWEPEPLRWVGTTAGLRLADAADAHEARTGSSGGWRTRLLSRLTGG